MSGKIFREIKLDSRVRSSNVFVCARARGKRGKWKTLGALFFLNVTECCIDAGRELTQSCWVVNERLVEDTEPAARSRITNGSSVTAQPECLASVVV